MSELIKRARELATEAHAGQRWGRHPYTRHLSLVATAAAANVQGLPVPLDVLVAAAWLHDVLEDTDASLEDVERACGEPVAEIVGFCTDVISGGAEETRAEIKERTYALWREGYPDPVPGGVYVKLCDRFVNVHFANISLAKRYAQEHVAFMSALRGHCRGEWLPSHEAMARRIDASFARHGQVFAR